VNIHEADIPGIGHKFQIETRNQEKLVIIFHDDGRRELYLADKRNPDEMQFILQLDDDEARQLAGIIGGMSYIPKTL